jgi:hypothetical protein
VPTAEDLDADDEKSSSRSRRSDRRHWEIGLERCRKPKIALFQRSGMSLLDKKAVKEAKERRNMVSEALGRL